MKKFIIFAVIIISLSFSNTSLAANEASNAETGNSITVSMISGLTSFWNLCVDLIQSATNVVTTVASDVADTIVQTFSGGTNPAPTPATVPAETPVPDVTTSTPIVVPAPATETTPAESDQTEQNQTTAPPTAPATTESTPDVTTVTPIQTEEPVTKPSASASPISITIDSSALGATIEEDNIVQLKAIVKLSDGTKRDVTKEATWQVIGPIGSISQGKFTPKLDDSVSEYGEYPGGIVAGWKDPESGNDFSTSTKIFKVLLKASDETGATI